MNRLSPHTLTTGSSSSKSHTYKMKKNKLLKEGNRVGVAVSENKIHHDPVEIAPEQPNI